MLVVIMIMITINKIQLVQHAAGLTAQHLSRKGG